MLLFGRDKNASNHFMSKTEKASNINAIFIKQILSGNTNTVL